jgi:hypothetical protein
MGTGAARHGSRAQADFDRLLDRMGRRMYPETMPALVFYWVRTARRKGYGCDEWRAVYRLLDHALQHAHANRQVFDALTSLHAYIRDEGLLTGQTRPPARRDPTEATWPELGSEALAAYVFRLLNEWAPKELALLLLDETEESNPDEPEVRALTAGRVMERLLLRTRLSPHSFETLLQSNVFTPKFVYPADYEVLRDVLLFLLGRTDAPPIPLLPPELLASAPDASFHPDYQRAVHDAIVVNAGGEKQELHVPISQEQVRKIFEATQFRIASLVITMDGRWWQSEKLVSGDRNAIVYRPVGQLRIDFSLNQARLRVPWAESRAHWPGPLPFPPPLELFGRRWRVAEWEQAAEGAWLNLECLGPLPVSALGPSARASLRRYRPAAVEMGWTALEIALAAGLSQKSGAPIDKLRHDELIPLGRSLYALTEAIMSRRLQTPDVIQTRLAGVAYRAAELRESHGPVPWRVLPKPVSDFLRGCQSSLDLPKPLSEIFSEAPETSPGSAAGGAHPFHILERLWNRVAAAPGRRTI